MRVIVGAMALTLAMLGAAAAATPGDVDRLADAAAPVASPERFLLGPPRGKDPVVLRVRFEIRDIDDIDDEAETFQFTGVMSLTWRDPRQAFDPLAAGVDEKIFQGDYQFDELGTGWYPQMVLVNESGLYDEHGVMLRVQPDGTSTLLKTIDANARAEFRLRRFPFDRQRLEAVFEVLGFDRDEVVLELEPEPLGANVTDVRVPQWNVLSVESSIRDRTEVDADGEKDTSRLVVAVDTKRDSLYITRLVVFPLFVIVFLSFSVFWMDRSSLGDRISVSFIGILTVVAYQLVISDNLPRISYVTLMHAFLNLSFLTMCATVVINLLVGAHDKRGQQAVGDLIDFRCRWIFPLVYLGLNGVLVAVAFTFF